MPSTAMEASFVHDDKTFAVLFFIASVGVCSRSPRCDAAAAAAPTLTLTMESRVQGVTFEFRAMALVDLIRLDFRLVLLTDEGKVAAKLDSKSGGTVVRGVTRKNNVGCRV